MKNEYTILSKWLEAALRKQGFRVVRTEPNRKDNTKQVWVFENNVDLQIAITCLIQKRKKKEGK